MSPGWGGGIVGMSQQDCYAFLYGSQSIPGVKPGIRGNFLPPWTRNECANLFNWVRSRYLWGAMGVSPEGGAALFMGPSELKRPFKELPKEALDNDELYDYLVWERQPETGVISAPQEDYTDVNWGTTSCSVSTVTSWQPLPTRYADKGEELVYKDNEFLPWALSDLVEVIPIRWCAYRTGFYSCFIPRADSSVQVQHISGGLVKPAGGNLMNHAAFLAGGTLCLGFFFYKWWQKERLEQALKLS
jgi:hypothetical protein